MRYAISYVSTASQTLDEKEIEKVLEWTKSWNNDHNITGMLLFSEGNFFQVIEGEKENILDLFQNIKNDKRHFNIIKIFSREINNENFDEYDTEFLSENKKYNPDLVENYTKHIQNLDSSSQSAVRNILSAFLAR